MCVCTCERTRDKCGRIIERGLCWDTWWSYATHKPVVVVVVAVVVVVVVVVVMEVMVVVVVVLVIVISAFIYLYNNHPDINKDGIRLTMTMVEINHHREATTRARLTDLNLALVC